MNLFPLTPIVPPTPVQPLAGASQVADIQELQEIADEIRDARAKYLRAMGRAAQVAARGNPGVWQHLGLLPSDVATVATSSGSSQPQAIPAAHMCDVPAADSPRSPFFDTGLGEFESPDESVWDFDGTRQSAAAPFDLLSTWNYSTSLNMSSRSPPSMSMGYSTGSSSYSESNPSVSPHSIFMMPFDAAPNSVGTDAASQPWAAPLEPSPNTASSSTLSELFDATSAPIQWNPLDITSNQSALARLFATCTAPPLVPTPAPSSSWDGRTSFAGRERSLSKGDARYSPMTRMPTSSNFTSPSVSPTLVPTAGADIPIDTLQLSSSPNLSSAQRREKRTHRWSVDEKKPSGVTRKLSHGKAPRSATEFNYDPTAVFPLNEEHEFIVYSQTKDQAEVSERGVTQLFLIDPPAGSPLARVTAPGGGEAYTAKHFTEDRHQYLFGDEQGRHWLVSYSGYSTKIHPIDPFPASESPSPVHTFVHFLPGTFVTSTLYPKGSVGWWRLQACVAPVAHDGFPGSGAWTARYDVEPTKRRPARILDHLANCRHRRCEGDHFALGKLARAVLRPVPSGSAA